MKNHIVTALAVGLLAGGSAISAETVGMKMDPPASVGTDKPQTHRAVGVVKSLDATKGMILLSHEPIASIKWPAMTMGFKISKALAASVKSGEKVIFEFTAKGMDATVTKIAVVK